MDRWIDDRIMDRYIDRHTNRQTCTQFNHDKHIRKDPIYGGMDRWQDNGQIYRHKNGNTYK